MTDKTESVMDVTRFDPKSAREHRSYRYVLNTKRYSFGNIFLFGDPGIEARAFEGLTPARAELIQAATGGE